MSRVELTKYANFLKNVLENNARRAAYVFDEGASRIDVILKALSEAGELEHALLDLFHTVRERITAELGDASLADLEAALVAKVKAFATDPEKLDGMIAELLHGVRRVQAELAPAAPPEPEPEPVTVPDAAPAPAPAPEPAWEYVYDANGIATGTRPLAAPPAPVDAPAATPEATAAPVDAPAVPSAETAT